MKYYIEMWERTFEPSGRTNKIAFWCATGIHIGIIAAFYVVIIVGELVMGGNFILESENFFWEGSNAILNAFTTYFFAAGFSSIMMQIRRLHDIGKSGWWLLLNLLNIFCFIGAIILFVFYLLDSKEENKWGIPKE